MPKDVVKKFNNRHNVTENINIRNSMTIAVARAFTKEEDETAEESVDEDKNWATVSTAVKMVAVEFDSVAAAEKTAKKKKFDGLIFSTLKSRNSCHSKIRWKQNHKQRD
jgi:hypothetical protein